MRQFMSPPAATPDGSFTGAGSIELGLHREIVERLEARLADLPARRRGALAWNRPEVSVVMSARGLRNGPVRDAVLREAVDDRVVRRRLLPALDGTGRNSWGLGRSEPREWMPVLRLLGPH
jgi:hypothetical protein